MLEIKGLNEEVDSEDNNIDPVSYDIKEDVKTEPQTVIFEREHTSLMESVNGETNVHEEYVDSNIDKIAANIVDSKQLDEQISSMMPLARNILKFYYIRY